MSKKKKYRFVVQLPSSTPIDRKFWAFSVSERDHFAGHYCANITVDFNQSGHFYKLRYTEEKLPDWRTL